MSVAAESTQYKNTPLQTHGGRDQPDVPPGLDQHDLDQPQPEPQPGEGAGGGGQPEGGGGGGGQLDLVEPSRHWSRLRGCCTGVNPTPKKEVYVLIVTPKNLVKYEEVVTNIRMMESSHLYPIILCDVRKRDVIINNTASQSLVVKMHLNIVIVLPLIS